MDMTGASIRWVAAGEGVLRGASTGFGQRARKPEGFKVPYQLFRRAKHDAVHAHGAGPGDVHFAVVKKQSLRRGFVQPFEAGVKNGGVRFHNFQLAGKTDLIEERKP